MLQIQSVKKQYVTGELVQTALNDVSLTLRDNEFVAILGPSGSGKTTLLNVIGGLDRYDSGDLIINGISTKKYSDRDWDSYRNHTIGFVFQSYNLIPHQTVLANVELALTISGISRSERRKRAVNALEQVGLGNQLHKRPNQMSGGQMQRVAIARALVNNPDILLADEPTGALDSETSVQVMELLKEVSRDRLVVMVTHNPELAQQYANRIVRLKDGRITDDSNPYAVDGNLPGEHKNMGRSSMSFWTALALSFNNLRTKKGRTILTAFAGSIGIIGIALIMSLSTGFQNYVDKIQEDTLSSYPLSIQSETADTAALMSVYGTMLLTEDTVEDGKVLEQQMISQLFAKVGTNDLASFKAHLESNWSSVEDDINILKYSYGIKPLIYSADTSEDINQVNPGILFEQMTGMSMMSSMMDSDVFYEMVDNPQMLEEQYELLRGSWPKQADELVIVLASPNQITDYMAYTLGLKDMDSLLEMIRKVMDGQEADDPGEPMQWSYDDLMALEFSLVPAANRYSYNAEYGVWEDMTDDTAYMRQQIREGTPLKVVGIVCPKEGVSTTLLSPGVGYTAELTNLVIEAAAQSQIVTSQLSTPDVDVFTGTEFGTEEVAGLDFENMISVDGEKITSAFGMNVNTQEMIAILTDQLEKAFASMDIDTTAAQEDFKVTFEALATDMLSSYVAENADPVSGQAQISLTATSALPAEYLATDNAQALLQALAEKYDVTTDTLEPIFQPLLSGVLTACIASDPVLPELPDIPAPEPTEEAEAVPTEAAEPTQGNDDVPDESPVTAIYASISVEDVPVIVSSFMELDLMDAAARTASVSLMQHEMEEEIKKQLGRVLRSTLQRLSSSFYVDEEQLASAFHFNMDESELRRLMEAMTGQGEESSYASNLRKLGYADLNKPTAISLYFVDFDAKSDFLSFLDTYNEDMQDQGLEDSVIRYTDITNIMMSSVRTIIDSVSYVLIAFVAVSLIVSSIMIGIITYISVMERTKEIGILRAIGASKRNISQVFNAETFIIGLCSGLIGVGITLLLNIPINALLRHLTDNLEIRAQLPPVNAVVLVLLSMGLTLLGGLIPSKHAAKKDPVIALRSE